MRKATCVLVFFCRKSPKPAGRQSAPRFHGYSKGVPGGLGLDPRILKSENIFFLVSSL